jgi:hypothetical protein
MPELKLASASGLDFENILVTYVSQATVNLVETKGLRAGGRCISSRSLLYAAGLIAESDGRGDIGAERGGVAFPIAIAHYVRLYQR